MVAGYVPPRENKRKLIYKSHLHIWDEPYLFRVCSDDLLKKCVPVEEAIKIIERHHYHHMEDIMVHFALIQRSGKVDSFGQPCMCVRGTGISIQGMPCHSPTTSRSNPLMSRESTTWDHFQSQRTMNTS
jgi:hypothetical protein